MKLQTQIPLKKAENQIGYDSQLLLLGSCFAESMGEKFDYFKFRYLRNPFGILFHPLAIEQLVSGAVREESYSEDDIFQLNERWHCFDAHSDVSDASPENLIATLNGRLEATRNQIATASHIIITLGTAWVYKHTETGGIVANCHKVPQNKFLKELLPIVEIAASLKRIIQLVQSMVPNAQLIFTVSPVRHLKDGFIENQRSKAHLISAVHQVMSGQVAYFPSYEIMMDELRDYRFYERDMLHPNQLAIDYIWEKFKQVWIEPSVYSTMDEVATVQNGLQHRPFHPESVQHQKFRKSIEAKIEVLKQKHPFLSTWNTII